MANDYYVVSGDSLREIADAIRTKSGTSAQLEFPDEWTDTIDDIQTGGGTPTIQSLTVTENGTYTAPSGVDGYSPVTVSVSGGGDTPIPDDGKTRIFIHIAEETPDNRLTFRLRFTASTASNTTVNWGDGTVETLGKTSAYNYTHKYSQGGDYVITMTVNTGTISFDGTSGTNGDSIYGSRANSNSYNRTRIQKVIIGDNVTSIGAYVFEYCYALSSITIPDSVTSIGISEFQTCYGLTSITIPDSVISIGANAFTYCYGISEYHFKPTTPPALESTNAFSGIQSDCIIYVPQGSLNAYKTATNYGGQVSKMREEPA